MTASEPSDLPLLEQAAGWFDKHSNNSLLRRDREEFERWREVPENKTAYSEVEAVFVSARNATEHPEMLALRHEALSRIVLPYGRRKRRMWIGSVIAASFAVAMVGLTSWTSFRDFEGTASQIAAVAPTTYRTAVGERLTVNLPDGSSVTLNTASRVRLSYTVRERRLILEQGQALFRVAKGEVRPFVVQALDRIVTAHGTTFDIRIAEDRKVKVALLEGSVSIAKAGAPHGTGTELMPSEVLVASADKIAVSREPEIANEVSWRDGLLIFENDSLAEATAEVNRYVRTPIILQDDRLGQIRVSGAFLTGETNAFVEALQVSLPVRVAKRDNRGIVLVYRG